MAIVLRVVAFKGVGIEPIEVEFGPFGGSIGRGRDNQLALPDPERFISRVQARVVVLHGGGYAIEHYGVNPIAINGQLVVKGAVVPLVQGDVMLIGEYEIAVVSADLDGDPFMRIVEAGAGADEMPFASPFTSRETDRPAMRISAPRHGSRDSWAIDESNLEDLFADTGSGDPLELERTNIRLSAKTARRSEASSTDQAAPDEHARDHDSPASLWRRLVGAARRGRGGGLRDV
jgi:predicted component of type VI protein secretion system